MTRRVALVRPAGNANIEAGPRSNQVLLLPLER